MISFEGSHERIVSVVKIQRAFRKSLLVTFNLKTCATSEKCMICLSEDDGKKYALQCGHTFHPHCVLHWFRSNKTCPCCRFQYKPSQIGCWSKILKEVPYDVLLGFGTNVLTMNDIINTSTCKHCIFCKTVSDEKKMTSSMLKDMSLNYAISNRFEITDSESVKDNRKICNIMINIILMVELYDKNRKKDFMSLKRFITPTAWMNNLFKPIPSIITRSYSLSVEYTKIERITNICAREILFNRILNIQSIDKLRKSLIHKSTRTIERITSLHDPRSFFRQLGNFVHVDEH